MSVLESRRALSLYVAAGAAFCAIAARGLLVPLYAHDLGASRFEVGALFSVSTLAGALLSLPSGLLIDRFGTRSLLWTSLILSAGSQLATATTTTVFPLYVWQVLGGLGAGAQQASLFSAVTETVPANRLGRSMGWLTFSMQAGFFMGPTIAGLMVAALNVRSVIAITTAVLLFAVPGALAATATRQTEGRLDLMTPLRALFGQKAFMPVVIGLISTTIVWGTVAAFLPIFGREALLLPNAQVGFLLALQAVANGVARLPGGRIVDRAPHRWPIVFTGSVVWAIATVVLGHLHGFVSTAVLMVVATPFMATAFVAIGVVFGNLSAASTRGVTMGVYGTVLFASLAAGPLLFGPLIQNFGYAAGFTACAAVSIALALVMAAMHAEPLRRRAEVPLPPATPGT
jgi:MFS family permease